MPLPPSLRRLREEAGRWARQVFWREVNRFDTPADPCPVPYNRPFTVTIEGGIYIEPAHCLLIETPRTIDRGLMAVDNWIPLRKPPLPLFWSRLAAGKYDRLPEAFLGSHYYCGGEYNHFHFLMDVVPRICHALENPDLDTVPIILAPCIMRSAAFAGFLKMSGQPRDRFIAPSRLTKVAKLHIANRPGITREKAQQLQRVLRFEPSSSPNRRLFIYRGTKRRALANRTEALAVAAAWGFEAVDFGAMPLREQLQTASDARWVIGEHGAGLTNLAFHRPGELGLIELLPEHEQSDCYRNICAQLDFSHAEIRGPVSGPDDAYTIDLKALEDQVQSMIGNV